MLSKFLIAMVCMISLALLAGCGQDGSKLFATHWADGGNTNPFDDGGENNPDIPLNPEPTTIALMGGGLAALAFMKRKKK